MKNLPVKTGLGSMGRVLVATFSSGAALVSILTFARSYGLIGSASSHLTVGSLGAAAIYVSPVADTAESIGDTLQLAALVKDGSGAALVGASLVWSTDDPEVATVSANGAVIARGPGATTIVATVGDLPARSRIVVRQRVVRVRIANDSTLAAEEGGRVPLTARGIDARGHTIMGRPVRWRIADTTIAAIDSSGALVALAPGQTVVEATVDGTFAHAPLTVRAVPGSLALAAGDGQRAGVGTVLPQQVVVRVADRRDRHIGGVPVRFRGADGHGVADPAIVFTDAEGRARTTWSLGPQPGRQRLYASVDHVDSAVVVVAEADPVAANTHLTAIGDEQQVQAGGEVAVGIRIADSTGAPLTDVPVSWVALDGGALAAVSARTDSVGEARARWTLGKKAGVQRARVQIGTGRGVPPLVVRAVGLPGPATKLALVSGGDQRGTVGRELAKPVVVRVTDAHGNPVAGVSLTLKPETGTVADSSIVTDSLGRARVAWQLSRKPGAHRLQVQAFGVDEGITVGSTARTGAAANVAFVGAPTEGVAGKALPKPVIVVVTDVYGNPVTDATVSFTTKSGRVTTARVATDAKGTAQTKWTLAGKSGDQSLAASVRGADARTSLVVTAAPAAQAARKPVAGKAKPRGD